MFRYCFGLINPDDAQPEEVILSFKPEQGRYIKSYPIHESQAVLTDNKQELRIRLTLFLIHDLVMEVLSYRTAVKVIGPERLINDIKAILTGAAARYGRTE